MIDLCGVDKNTLSHCWVLSYYRKTDGVAGVAGIFFGGLL